MKKSANFILTLAALFISLCAAELMVRQFEKKIPQHPPQPPGWAIIPEETWIEHHPVLGWVPQKNKRAALRKQNLTIPIATNSRGMRGEREYVNPKPPGIFRIHAIGDSFTFGFGVRDAETFPAQLETMNSRLEVLNWGVPGYGVDQIALLMRENGYSDQADLAIISIFPEDYWRATRAFNDAGNGKPYFTFDSKGNLQLRHMPVPKDKNFSTNQFPDLFERKGLNKLIHSSALMRLGIRAWTKIQKRLGREDPDTTPEWLLGRAILKDMLAQMRARGIKPLFLIVPPQRWIIGTTEPVRESMIRFAAREQADILDLTSVFLNAAQAKGVDTYYIPDDLHWTPAGHRLVADEILKYLQSHHMLPDSNASVT